MNQKETILFFFVPTMGCNFQCDYCFLEKDRDRKTTMFDNHSVDEWVDGMKKYDCFNVDMSFWGGEPFSIDETYELLRRFVEMDHVISGIRVDSNIFFADKIVEKCPSEKIKINCSYHMQYHTLEEEFRKVKLLKKHDMVAMVNFVASKYNLSHLKNDYNMTVVDLINKFADIDVFVNVAGDFSFANDPDFERYSEYREFIQQFISPEEWVWLRGVRRKCRCEAGRKFFRVENDGTLLSCIDNYQQSKGNFFKGELIRSDVNEFCEGGCRPIIKYSFRCDNDFPTEANLLAYVERNKEYRKNKEDDFFDFKF